MPIAQLDGTWVLAAFVADSGVCEISTACIHYLALLLLRDLGVMNIIRIPLRHWRDVSTYVGVDAEVFTTCETNAVKTLLLLALFVRLRAGFAVVHQTL